MNGQNSPLFRCTLGGREIFCDKFRNNKRLSRARMTRAFGPYLILAGLLAAAPAWAEIQKPGDFTFRRVGLPAPGSRNRITVQIAPAPPSAPQAPAAAGTAVAATGAVAPMPRVGAVDWFWQDISPRIEDSGPGRLTAALQELQRAPPGEEIAGPRLQGLQQIAQAHGIDILKATVGTQVSPALVVAVIAVESAGQSDAVSGAGARGLMQLMPDTADRFGVSDSLDATDNIKGGVAYLDWLMTRFDRDPILVLAGYNAGEGSVRDSGGVPDYPETRAYVPKVLAAWQVARGLCLTPPELITDGCVFAAHGG